MLNKIFIFTFAGKRPANEFWFGKRLLRICESVVSTGFGEANNAKSAACWKHWSRPPP